ncbi:DUF4177 domain-containing protein [Paenibacillus sp. An7]|uniref:DUF4177 domain-containing protein n=1 Tax=Paenibacillus sp. An7 TaxID=2689577 RepID=UPI001F1C444B|nr:DUF4177 domain-containing protein [Paenibacillus sp. An7]
MRGENEDGTMGLQTMKYKTGGFLGGKVDKEEFEQELNEHGLDGWELVSCFDTWYFAKSIKANSLNRRLSLLI